MKETDIRSRINAFLEAKLRKAMLPVGLGVAFLSGCSGEATPVYSAPTDASNGSDAMAKYMGPMPDAQPLYMAVQPDAGQDAVEQDATGVKYMAVMPDGATDSQTGVLYMAAMPKV